MTEASTTRTMRVVGYVDLSLREVVALLARPDGDELLRTTLRATLRRQPVVEFHVGRPTVVSDRSACVAVDWHGAEDGRTVVQLVVVQSGAEPKTEVVLSLEVVDDTSRAVAAAAHHFLDELTDRLVAAAA